MDRNTEGPACLVTQSSQPQVFSAGLDFKYLHKVLCKIEERDAYLKTY